MAVCFHIIDTEHTNIGMTEKQEEIYRMPKTTAAPAATAKADPHTRETAEVLTEFGSSVDGLDGKEAARRLAADGPNELKSGARVNPLHILLNQFKSMLIWILAAACVISILLGEKFDAFVILTIILFNTAIGFTQELKAEHSIAALKKMSAPRAKIFRDNRIATIPAAEIVVGDILVFEAGDIIAADGRIIEAVALKCDESALTGESVPAEKNPEAIPQPEVALGDRKNTVFMGTSVAAGSGRAVIAATGMDTELGRIAGLLQEVVEEDKTPLQKDLDSLGRILIGATLGIVAISFGIGLLRGADILDLLMTSVSLAIAAVPEGMSAVVTVALALGVMRMARRHALVRRLPAVEILGSTGVICTDKTGTLTAGEMTVRVLHAGGKTFQVSGNGYGPEGEISFDGKPATVPLFAPLGELATVLLSCNNSKVILEKKKWKVIGDPTEGALLAAAGKTGITSRKIEEDMPRYFEIPFDSDRKRRTVVRKMKGGALKAFINGAPDVLLGLCTKYLAADGIRTMTDDDRSEITAQNTAMAKQALRVLGSAFRDLDTAPPDRLDAENVEKDLVFAGLSGMYDPPRKEAKEAITKCIAAGIRVVMITGDHPETAIAVARELGIAGEEARAVTGLELDKTSGEELQRRVLETTVYARVTAENKLRIVRAWKAAHTTVAMTGDGVNDAPAIKQADIGIAMGTSGTEVTKQAADMIITDDNFATIVTAVEEGRGIYDNIRKTLQYLLAGNVGEIAVMAAAVLAGMPVPLLPIHLLWINLVTDGPPALCLAGDPTDPGVMMARPRDSSEKLANGEFLFTMIVTGFLTAAAAFAVYRYMLEQGTVEAARTYTFAVLVFAELLRSFGARSAVTPVWKIPFFSNGKLVATVCASIALQIWSQHNAVLGRFLKTTGVSFFGGFILLAIGSMPFLVLEIIKTARQKYAAGKKRDRKKRNENEAEKTEA